MFKELKSFKGADGSSLMKSKFDFEKNAIAIFGPIFALLRVKANSTNVKKHFLSQITSVCCRFLTVLKTKTTNKKSQN